MEIPLKTLEPSPPPAFDNSILSTHQRCPRRALYEYYLDRAVTAKNWPIQFGTAYHRFREILDEVYLQNVVRGDAELSDIADQAFDLAWEAALRVEGGFEDPPDENRKSYLHEARLRQTCEMAFKRWQEEKATDRVEVLQAEQAFELELPNGEMYTGRMDQIIEWNGDIWVRDFKTTSRMGRTYADNFEPNNQMTGYVWAAQELSGQSVDGVWIEVVYNTKRNGPEFHDFLTTRGPQAIREWKEETQYEIEQARQHESDGIFPKRTTACNDYGGCPFREACNMGSWRARENWLKTRTVHSHWDPMNPDEEESDAITHGS